MADIAQDRHVRRVAAFLGVSEWEIRRIFNLPLALCAAQTAKQAREIFESAPADSEAGAAALVRLEQCAEREAARLTEAADASELYGYVSPSDYALRIVIERWIAVAANFEELNELIYTCEGDGALTEALLERAYARKDEFLAARAREAATFDMAHAIYAEARPGGKAQLSALQRMITLAKKSAQLKRVYQASAAWPQERCLAARRALVLLPPEKK